MGAYDEDLNDSKKGSLTGTVFTIIFVVLYLVLSLADSGLFDGIGEWYNGLTPRNYYTTEVKIDKGTVQEKVTEKGKYYIRISNADVKTEDSWIEVKQDFYDKHSTFISYYSSGNNEEIGLLLCKNDVYKGRFWGLFGKETPNFEKTVWQVADVYDTYDIALESNPHQIQTVSGKVYKKKSLNGKNYIVIDVEGNKIKEEVDLTTYNKYEVDGTINCKFESWGDIRQFKGIV